MLGALAVWIQNQKINNKVSDLREMICALTVEQEWLVRRAPGIGSHTGRRVRDGHFKGPGPNRTQK